jgi:hypothetical protein
MSEETNGSEETTEATDVETQDESTQEEVSDDHPTKLGRKVKALAETTAEKFEGLSASIEEMKSMLTTQTASAEQFKYKEPEGGPDPDDFVTFKDAEKLYEARKAQDEQKDEQYRGSYAKELSIIAQKRGIEPEEYKAIEKELLENHYGNGKTGNAKQDAWGQFNAAENAYLRKKIASGSKTPLKGSTEHPPLGAPGAETKTPNSAPQIKIDAEMAQLMRDMGKDPGSADDVAWVQKTLAK